MRSKHSPLGNYEMGIAIVGGLTAAFAIVFFIRMVSPVICEKAVSKLQSRFTVICNEAVMEYIKTNDIKYDDLVDIQRGDDGRVQAMNTNMRAVNDMKSSLSLAVQKELDKMDSVTVKFPSNGFFGLDGGIDIPVQVIYVSALETKLNSTFEAVGINQTRLYITVTLKIDGKLLLCGDGETVSIKTAVPISQTVIVGDVPGTYLNVKKQ